MLTVAIATGSFRPDSEDAAACFPMDDGLVVVVADGAGGFSGGAEASTRLVRRVEAAIATRAIDAWVAAHWVQLLRDVDHDLARGSIGETTAVVLALARHGVVGACAGDSEAWSLRPTVSALTDGQGRKRLGTGRASPTPIEAPMPTMLVAATDGLFRHARRDDILASADARDADAIARRLVASARTPRGEHADDVAVVVVTWDGVGLVDQLQLDDG